mmetsp:Transcript_19787/g.48389  ORF Transcript_19787/g.48389 Transcript_19787/m.48389 type:complete len:293 (-) Transcript_19787:3701-4579(-)
MFFFRTSTSWWSGRITMQRIMPSSSRSLPATSQEMSSKRWQLSRITRRGFALRFIACCAASEAMDMIMFATWWARLSRVLVRDETVPVSWSFITWKPAFRLLRRRILRITRGDLGSSPGLSSFWAARPLPSPPCLRCGFMGEALQSFSSIRGTLSASMLSLLVSTTLWSLGGLGMRPLLALVTDESLRLRDLDLRFECPISCSPSEVSSRIHCRPDARSFLFGRFRRSPLPATLRRPSRTEFQATRWSVSARVRLMCELLSPRSNGCEWHTSIPISEADLVMKPFMVDFPMP